MSALPPDFQCNECGKRRSVDANSWKTIMVSTSLGDRSITIINSFVEAYKKEDLHACGEECAHKMLQKFFAGQI